MSKRRGAETDDPSDPFRGTRWPKDSHDSYELVQGNEFVLRDNVVNVSEHDEHRNGVVREL